LKSFYPSQCKLTYPVKLVLTLLVVSFCLCIDNVNAAETTSGNEKQPAFLTPDQRADRISKTLFKKGKLKEAEAALLEIIRVSPTSAGAYFWLGRLSVQTGDNQSAAKYFQNSIVNDPVNLDARLEWAIALEKMNNIVEAGDIFEFVLRIDAKNLVARHQLAGIRLKQGKLDIAMTEYNKVIQIAPSSPAAKQAKAVLDTLYVKQIIQLASDLSSKKGRKKAILVASQWIKQKQIEPAKRLLLEFIIQYPENPDANYYMGLVSETQGDMRSTLKYFSSAVLSKPKNVKFLYDYAKALAKLGKKQKALTLFQKIINVADDGPIKRQAEKQLGVLEVDSYIQAGNPKALLKQYEIRIENDKNNVFLLTQLAKLQNRLGMRRKASETIARVEKLKNIEKAEKSLIVQARTLIGRKKFKEAEFRLNQLLKNRPNHPQALYWLSIVYERQEKYEMAVKSVKRSVELTPNNIALKKELARLLALAGHMEEVTQVYDALIKQADDDAKKDEYIKLRHFAKGQHFMQNNNFKKAGNHYQAMSRLFPKDISVLEALARSNIQLGDLEGAEKAYLKALKINDKRTLTYLRLVGIYTQMKNDEKRRAYYKKALIIDPAGALGKQALQNLLLIAQTAIENGKFEEALDEYNVVLGVFPNNHIALKNATKAAQNIRRFNVASVLFRRLINNNPSSFVYRVALARMYIQTGELDNAIREFEKIVALVPKSTEGREAKANLDILYNSRAEQIIVKLDTEVDRKAAVGTARLWIQKKNQVAPAKRILLAVLKKDKQNEQAHYWIGTVYDRYRQFNLSVLHVANSIALAPYNLQLISAFGRILARTGNLDAAEALYEKVISEAKDTRLADVTKKSLVFIVAQRLILEGKPDEALEQYEKMYQKYPNDAGLLARIASVYLSQKNFRAAEQTFKAVIKLEPNSPSVYLQMAQLYKEQGNEAARKEALRKVIALDPNGLLGHKALNEFGLADGMDKLKDGRWKEAIAIFNHVLKIEPDNSYAMLALGRAYIGLRDYDRAKTIFLKMLASDPGNMKARLKLANVYVSIKQTASAVNELRRIVAVSRETAEGREALVNLSNIYRERGAAALKKRDADLAVEEYRKAVSLDKNDWRAHLILGEIFLNGSKKASAVNRGKFMALATFHLSESVRIRPDNYDVHLKLGAIYEAKRDVDRARDSFAYALSLLTKDNVSVRNLLINSIRIQVARKEFAAKNFTWVLNELVDMLALEPNSVRLHLFNATVYTAKRDLEAATFSMKKAVKLAPKNVTARYRLAQLYEQTNALERAANQYRAIIFANKSGRIVDVARERLIIVEEKLSILTFRIKYSSEFGGNEFEGGFKSKSFNSSVRLDMIANFRPRKNIGLSFNASPTYSSYHLSESDSLSSSYGFSGNMNFDNGFISTSFNQRETTSVLLDLDQGKSTSASLSGSRRLLIPLSLSDSGSVSPSTVRVSLSAQEFEPSALDFTFNFVRTYSTSVSFSHPLKRGGSLTATYSLSDANNLDARATDYANQGHNVSLSLSRPVASKLYGFISAGITYQRYKNLDTVRFASIFFPEINAVSKRRQSAMGNMSLGLSYQLHRKLSFVADISYAENRTNIARGLYMYNSLGSLVGLKSSTLSDYKNFRSSLSFQFQF